MHEHSSTGSFVVAKQAPGGPPARAGARQSAEAPPPTAQSMPACDPGLELATHAPKCFVLLRLGLSESCVLWNPGIVDQPWE